MTSPPRCLGAVLAGGASRRLGRDKAAEPLGGLRLIDRAVGALRGACPEVVVISARPDTPRGDWTVIGDLRPSCGPLGGIETALDRARCEGYAAAFVLACDLPLVDRSSAASLLAEYGAGPAVAALREGDPDFEPLCAVYGTGCLPVVADLLDRGERAACALFRAVGGRRVAMPGAGLNVNDEEDLARANAAVASPREEDRD